MSTGAQLDGNSRKSKTRSSSPGFDANKRGDWKEGLGMLRIPSLPARAAQALGQEDESIAPTLTLVSFEVLHA